MIGGFIGYALIAPMLTRTHVSDPLSPGDVAGRSLHVRERNRAGDCLCLVEGSAGSGVVTVQAADVLEFLPREQRTYFIEEDLTLFSGRSGLTGQDLAAVLLRHPGATVGFFDIASDHFLPIEHVQPGELPGVGAVVIVGEIALPEKVKEAKQLKAQASRRARRLAWSSPRLKGGRRGHS